MSRGRVTSKVSSLPSLAWSEPASNHPLGTTSPQSLGRDGFDRVGLSFARISTTKFCAVIAVLIVSASLFASVLL